MTRRLTHKVDESGEDEEREGEEEERRGVPLSDGSKSEGGLPVDVIEDELEDEVFLDEEEDLPDEFYEIVQSITDGSPSCRINLRKRVATVPRKPDYSAYSYRKSDSDSENVPPASDLAVATNPDDDVNSASGSGPLLDLSSKLNEIGPEEAKGGGLELREMFAAITQADLDKYEIGFLDDDEGKIRNAVSRMCHSLRFWLAVKFSNSLARSRGLSKRGVMTSAKISRLLGVDHRSLRKHLSSPNNSMTFLEFKGYSPLEFNCMSKCTHPQIIKKLASNWDSNLVQGIVNKKNKK